MSLRNEHSHLDSLLS